MGFLHKKPMSTPETPSNTPPAQPRSFIDQVRDLHENMDTALQELRTSNAQLNVNDIPASNPFARESVYNNTRRLLEHITSDQNRMQENTSVRDQLVRLKGLLEQQQLYHDIPVVSPIARNPRTATAVIGSIIGVIGISKLADAIYRRGNRSEPGVLYKFLKLTGLVALAGYIVTRFPPGASNRELAPNMRGIVVAGNEVQVHAQLLQRDFVVGGAEQGSLTNTGPMETLIQGIANNQAYQGKNLIVVAHCTEAQRTDMDRALRAALQRVAQSTNRQIQLRIVVPPPAQPQNTPPPAP